ncbi:MAG TPA: hypothetical protein PKD37_03780 [Oligoflexia bacterium]|nr:hypothetical protein [Oligoflexia bacterium]HMP27087.1 hypothetical protein [Oligoflexia bacterium]
MASISFSNTLSTAKSLGRGVDTAEQNLRKALASGNKDQIAAAQLEYDKRAESFQLFMKLRERAQQLIQQIIQSLGRQ